MKKFISTLMAFAMALSLNCAAFAQDANSRTETYKAADGSTLIITLNDGEYDDCTINLDGAVYDQASAGFWGRQGYTNESSDGKVTFSQGQFMYGFTMSDGSAAAGLIEKDGAWLLMDDSENPTFYLAQPLDSNTDADTTTYKYKIVKTYNRVSSSDTGTSAKTVSVTGTYQSDTGSKVTIAYGGVYQFKITSLNGKKPTFVVPGKSFQVTANGSNGNQYYFKVKAVGKDGNSAGVYINGEKTPSTVITISDKIQVDTGAKLTVKAGKSYTFKITASSKPSFICGTNSAFHVVYVGHNSNYYFYKVTAIGKSGQGTGFYVNGSKTPCTVGIIA